MEQTATYKEFLSNQEKLYKSLFDNYSAELNGVYIHSLYNSEDTNITDVPPKFKLTISSAMMKLVDVVEPEEKVKYLFDYWTSWVDIRLTWNPADFGGIDHLYVPRSKIWVPEVVIVDCSEILSYENEFTKYAQVRSNGSVSYYTSSITSVICELDVYKFPMDEHTCSVNFLFHSYSVEEFEIETILGTMPKPIPLLGNGEWEMKSLQMSIEHVGGGVQIHKFEASFSRNPGFYIALVMIPAYFINVLSIIALFMNIDNRSEKLTIGLTNIMSMSFILAILSADLPKTQNLPLLAIYVITSLVIMLSSISAVVALPKIRSWVAGKRRSPVEKEKEGKEESPPKTCFGKIVHYFRIEYFLMFIFQLANLANFIVMFL